MTSDRPGGDALLAQRLVELADTLVADYDVVDLLDRLVHASVELLPVTQAGLLLVDQNGRLEVLASTSEATRLLELLQLQAEGGGPCVDCVRSGDVVAVSDLEAERARWPRFVDHALSLGFTSVHALPLRLRAEVIGGLNLFSGGEHVALTAQDGIVARAMADMATIGILQQRSIHRASLVAEQLQNALSTRVVIEQAKGVLAESGGLDMDRAFGALRAFARSSNLRLGDVALSLVQRTRQPEEVLSAVVAPPTGQG